jgi:hypothetical protein
MSLSAAIGYRGDGTRARLFFQTCPDSYNTERLIGFLEDLRREVRGGKVILNMGRPAGAQESRDFNPLRTCDQSVGSIW